MKTSLFIATILVSGALAGLVHSGANIALVEPYLDAAIQIENQSMFESGQADDNSEFWDSHESYREWQKVGQVVAGIISGMAMGSLFGVVFALSRHALPGSRVVKKAVVLAGIMWLVIFFIPFLKYPANPPTIGETETVEYRVVMYVLFVAISGFGMAGVYQIAKRVRRNRVVAGAGLYAALIVAAFVLMPPNPDEATAPNGLIDGFRVASVLGVSTFWAVLPLTLGAVWNKLKPDADIRM